MKLTYKWIVEFMSNENILNKSIVKIKLFESCIRLMRRLTKNGEIIKFYGVSQFFF